MIMRVERSMSASPWGYRPCYEYGFYHDSNLRAYCTLLLHHIDSFTMNSMDFAQHRRVRCIVSVILPVLFFVQTTAQYECKENNASARRRYYIEFSTSTMIHKYRQNTHAHTHARTPSCTYWAAQRACYTIPTYCTIPIGFY